jgi:hypothetical protein
MAQFESDTGFCAVSDHGVVAYVQFLNLVPEDGDHTLTIRVTAYDAPQ